MTTTMKANGASAEIEATDIDTVHLRRLRKQTDVIRVVGLAPLIVHAWSHKARQMMLDKQQGKATKKDPKDPIEDFEASRYRLDDGTDGFPAPGLKAAIADAARFFDSLTIVQTKQLFFIEGVTTAAGDPLVRILDDNGNPAVPSMREDMVRIGPGTADIRYRAQYWPWSMDVRLTYLPQQITAESIAALVDAAGNGGIGEWRPSAPKGKGGTFGRFEVA